MRSKQPALSFSSAEAALPVPALLPASPLAFPPGLVSWWAGWEVTRADAAWPGQQPLRTLYSHPGRPRGFNSSLRRAPPCDSVLSPLVVEFHQFPSQGVQDLAWSGNFPGSGSSSPGCVLPRNGRGVIPGVSLRCGGQAAIEFHSCN